MSKNRQDLDYHALASAIEEFLTRSGCDLRGKSEEELKEIWANRKEFPFTKTTEEITNTFGITRGEYMQVKRILLGRGVSVTFITGMGTFIGEIGDYFRTIRFYDALASSWSKLARDAVKYAQGNEAEILEWAAKNKRYKNVDVEEIFRRNR